MQAAGCSSVDAAAAVDERVAGRGVRGAGCRVQALADELMLRCARASNLPAARALLRQLDSEGGKVGRWEGGK